jgi:hypothetical protein
MKKKILFLIQRPNAGGLNNLVNEWALILSNKFDVTIKVIETDKFSLKDYNITHLFFSPFYSKKLFFNLLLYKFFFEQKEYYNYLL